MQCCHQPSNRTKYPMIWFAKSTPNIWWSCLQKNICFSKSSLNIYCTGMAWNAANNLLTGPNIQWSGLLQSSPNIQWSRLLKTAKIFNDLLFWNQLKYSIVWCFGTFRYTTNHPTSQSWSISWWLTQSSEIPLHFRNGRLWKDISQKCQIRANWSLNLSKEQMITGCRYFPNGWLGPKK